MSTDKEREASLARGPHGPVIGVFCVIVTGVAVAICRALLLWEPATATETTLRVILLALFGLLVVFSALGIVWAFVSPSWLIRIVQRLYPCVLVCLITVLAIFLGVLVYFAWVR